MWNLTIQPEWNCHRYTEHENRADVLDAVQLWCDDRDRFTWTPDTRKEVIRRMGDSNDSICGEIRDMAIPHEAGVRTDGGRNCGRWYAVRIS